MKRLLLPLVVLLFACQQAPQPASDFSLSLETGSLVLALSQNKTVQYRLSTTGNLPSRPQLRLEQADGSPLPAGFTLGSDAPDSFILGATAVLEPKTYELRLVGRLGETARSARLSVRVINPDFALGLSRLSLGVEQGAGGLAAPEVELSLSPQEGFSQTLNQLRLRFGLTDGRPLPAGLSYLETYDPASPNRARLRWFASTAVSPGTYRVQIEVQSQTRTRAVELALEVQPLAEFNLSAPPTAAVTQQGGSVEVPITISRGVSFNRPLSLQAQVFNRDARLVAGVTGVFTPNPAESGQTTLRLQVDDSVSECYFQCFYTVRVGASAGGVERFVDSPLRVEPRYDFGLSWDPRFGEVRLEQLETVGVNISVEHSFTFRDPISLSFDQADGRPLPTGLTASVSQNPVQFPNSFTPVFQATREVPAGLYAVRIRGTSGSLVRSVTVPVRVRLAPDFSLAVNPPVLNVIRGRSHEVAVSLARNAAEVSYDVPVTLEREDGSSLPAGLGFYLGSDSTGSVPYGYVRDSSRLVLRISPDVPLGTLRLRLRGTINLRNPLERTASLVLNVADSSVGTLVTVRTVQPYEPFAFWAAFQDGGGAWQGLDGGATDTLRFRVTDPSGRYGVAVNCGGSSRIVIYQLTLAETTNPRLGCGIGLGGSESSEPVGQITAVERSPYLRPVISWTGSAQLYQADLAQYTSGLTVGFPLSLAVSSGWMQGRSSYTLPDLSTTPGWVGAWGFRPWPSSLGWFTLGRLTTNRSVGSALNHISQVAGMPPIEPVGLVVESHVLRGNWITE